MRYTLSIRLHVFRGRLDRHVCVCLLCRSEQWRRERHGIRAGHTAEAQTTAQSHNVHRRPAGGTGEGFPEDSVPGRLHQGGTRAEVSHNIGYSFHTFMFCKENVQL